jgi:hypothetical protein
MRHLPMVAMATIGSFLEFSLFQSESENSRVVWRSPLVIASIDLERFLIGHMIPCDRKALWHSTLILVRRVFRP